MFHTVTIQRGDLDIDVDVEYEFDRDGLDYVKSETHGMSSEGEKVELTKEEIRYVEREIEQGNYPDPFDNDDAYDNMREN